MFFSNGLIGLREGLEAGMVVAVLVAFLTRLGRRREIRLIWAGITAAIAVAVLVAVVLAITAASMSERGEELFAGIASIVAVVLVTGMIFWMRHSMREARMELESQLGKAIRIGPAAVFAVAFVAILREGLEATVFVLVLSRDSGAGAGLPILGFLSGVAVATTLTWLICRGLVRVSLAKVLTVTGLLLVVVASGILAHGIEDLQHAGVLPGATAIAFDAQAVLPPGSWHTDLLIGVFSISAKPTVLAAVAWLGYLVTVLALFLRALHRPLPATGTAGLASAREAS